LSQKWVLFVFAVMAFTLAPFVPSALAGEQTEAEHLVPAPGGFLAPTLEGPWRSRITLNAWLPTTITNTCISKLTC
jgi:hypothetical protein